MEPDDHGVELLDVGGGDAVDRTGHREGDDRSDPGSRWRSDVAELGYSSARRVLSYPSTARAATLLRQSAE